MKYLYTEKENIYNLTNGYQTVEQKTFDTLAEAQLVMLQEYSAMLKYIVENYDIENFDYAVGTKSAHITEYEPDGTNKKLFKIQEIKD